MIDLQIYFQKITLWIKKRKLSVWSLEKKLLQFLFGILINATFFQIFFGAGTEKRLEATDLYNKYKERRNE